MRVRLALLLCPLLVGCGGGSGGSGGGVPGGGGALPASLLAAMRPIGRGTLFRPPARGPVAGRCLPHLGRRNAAHVEVFAANRVVVVARGIGVRGPVALTGGRIVRARCYGALVTLEPTGVVWMRADARLVVADLFRSWGVPLSRRWLAGFRGSVRAYVDGAPWRSPPGAIPLRPGAEIVLEVGPHVPPHRAYTFPPPPAR